MPRTPRRFASSECSSLSSSVSNRKRPLLESLSEMLAETKFKKYSHDEKKVICDFLELMKKKFQETESTDDEDADNDDQVDDEVRTTLGELVESVEDETQ